MLVEHWLLETHEIYHQARAIYISKVKWNEIEWSERVNLVSYTLEHGLKKHLVSMTAVIVREGGRAGEKQQTIENMDSEKWDNAQEIVRFFIEHSKKPDITVTITIVYSRFDSKSSSGPAKKFESLESASAPSLLKDVEVVSTQASKQKGVVRTESRRTVLEAARDRSMTLDELLTAQKCTVQGCRQGPYCLDLANTHYNISR